MNSWVELDTGVLAANIDNVRAQVDPSTELIFVVKANAYGHGVEAVSRCAWDAGVRWFAVAHECEAEELRAALPEAVILIVGAIAPAHAERCIQGGFIPIIASEQHARGISKALSRNSGRLTCHAKIDTGMGRLGIAWQDAARILKMIDGDEKLSLSGVCTHFASSDSGSREFFDEQRCRFDKVLADAAEAGIDCGFRHASNSGAVLWESACDFNGIRPGLVLYGYGSEHGVRGIRTRPILQWKTRVVQVKSVPQGFPVSYDSTYITPAETCIATVDVGYSDGYPRALSSKGTVLIGGRRLPVAGRVTMNLITVDCGAESPVKAGDEVVLLGEQGDESIWADELAMLSGTISYEILTGIRPGSVKVK